MSRINVRNKGANGEREIIHILQATIDDVWKEFEQEYNVPFEPLVLIRNTHQSAIGGEDIAGLPWYSCEVKRVEKLELGKWWVQCVRQAGSTEGSKFRPSNVQLSFGRVSTGVVLTGTAGAADKVPLLFYRQNKSSWSVMMWGALELVDGRKVRCPVDIAMQAFLTWFRVDLRVRVEREFLRLFPSGHSPLPLDPPRGIQGGPGLPRA